MQPEITDTIKLAVLDDLLDLNCVEKDEINKYGSIELFCWIRCSFLNLASFVCKLGFEIQ